MAINLSQYFHWDVVLMCVALSVVFGFEMAGIFGKHYITITALVRGYLPFWSRAMILGWLCYHFMVNPR